MTTLPETEAKARLEPFNVFEWAGKDVAGKLAVIRQKDYWDQGQGTLPVRKLLKITRKSGRGGIWVHVYWEPVPNAVLAHDCGYSGWREDGESHPKPVLYFVKPAPAPAPVLETV